MKISLGSMILYKDVSRSKVAGIVVSNDDVFLKVPWNDSSRLNTTHRGFMFLVADMVLL